MKKDLVIGIVGTVILVVAMIGVFKYEASRGGGSSFQVTWAEATAAGPSESGTLQEGASDAKDLDVNATNVTKIEWTLSWTDDVGNNDAFEFVVTSPSGVNRTGEGSNGKASVVFENLTAMPAEMRILASSEADAEARIARDATTTAAQGVWVVSIRLASAPGQASPGGVDVPPDNGNAWSLTSTLTVYEPRFAQG